MIEIRSLTAFDPLTYQQISTGYIAQTVYEVKKHESRTRTVFSLERVERREPFVKRWEHTADDLATLGRLVEMGYSLGAYEGEVLVGYAFCEPRLWNKTLWLVELEVAASFRSQRIGTQLMQAVFRMAEEGGFRCVGLETQNTNTRAIDFYYKNGFTIDGIDVSFYTNEDLHGGEVAVFMKRKVG